VKKRIGIRLQGIGHADVSGNRISGMDEGISAKQVERFTGKNNEITDKLKPSHNNPRGRRDEWYKKPIGIIVLTVMALVLASIVIAILHTYFPAIH
jgi:hypothetical protein